MNVTVTAEDDELGEDEKVEEQELRKRRKSTKICDDTYCWRSILRTNKIKPDGS